MYKFFLTSITALLISVNTVFAKPLTISTMQSHAETRNTINEIMTEAYRRIDKTFELAIFPDERAINMSNSGYSDAELFRKKHGIEENYPNLIRVPVCIHQDPVVAYTNINDLEIESWESLEPYRVGYQRGFKGASMNLTTETTSLSLTSVEQALRMLESDRLDVVIDIQAHGDALVNELNLEGVYRVEKPLMIIEAYHYLNIKNHDLLKPLTQALEDMEREGLITKP